jgi:hypothetical protein
MYDSNSDILENQWLPGVEGKEGWIGTTQRILGQWNHSVQNLNSVYVSFVQTHRTYNTKVTLAWATDLEWQSCVNTGSSVVTSVITLVWNNGSGGGHSCVWIQGI